MFSSPIEYYIYPEKYFNKIIFGRIDINGIDQFWAVPNYIKVAPSYTKIPVILTLRNQPRNQNSFFLSLQQSSIKYNIILLWSPSLIEHFTVAFMLTLKLIDLNVIVLKFSQLKFPGLRRD